MKKIIALVVIATLLMGTSAMSFANPLELQLTDKKNDVGVRSVIVDPGGATSLPSSLLVQQYQVVNYLGSVSQSFQGLDLYTREAANAYALYKISNIHGWSALALGLAEILHRSEVIDVYAIGGVYTRGYYVRKIVNPAHANATVPVAYQFTFVTVFYNSPAMLDSNIEYIRMQNDGGPRLAVN